MVQRCDRRTFLGRLGRAGLVVPALPILGCAGERTPDPLQDVAGPAGSLDPVTRPILVPWSGDRVRILSPLDEVPMAYVSRGRRQVFVDRSFRDRSNWILDAHISVSTGLWRIPLPGDPVGEAITPGDTLREFEELDMAEWDPAMEPADGDFRIRRGMPAVVRVDFSCIPLATTDDWLSAGPWDIRQCDGVGEEACREDFVEVGVGTRNAMRGCAGDRVPVGLVTWACPDQGA